MILRASEESIPEPADRADVRRQYNEFCAASRRIAERNLDAMPVAVDPDAS